MRKGGRRGGMKTQDLRIVHDKWLWQRAGALETKLLKKYKKSLARISISQEFNECVMVSHYGEDIMEIDYAMYRKICKDIESRYAHPIEKGGVQE